MGQVQSFEPIGELRPAGVRENVLTQRTNPQNRLHLWNHATPPRKRNVI